jgi:hypothetical protein
VKSADPAKWGEAEVVKVLDIPAPATK